MVRLRKKPIYYACEKICWGCQVKIVDEAAISVGRERITTHGRAVNVRHENMHMLFGDTRKHGRKI